jgi:membrane-associated protease RseP (regulator of RpoE activity)
MTEMPGETAGTPSIQQNEFEQISKTVSVQFQVDEGFLLHGIPTYHLKQPQETKQPFLKILRNLEPMNLTAILRRIDGKLVLKVVPKPPAKRSNIKVNWLLFFATIATTFFTGYVLSIDFPDKAIMPSPFVGGASFTIAIMVVLGLHEMGHKLTANKKGIEATPPYFIPGPPPIGGLLGIGTFGAVIMQKSLPPNRDALFDIGSNGPILGFILAVVVSIIGLWLSPILPVQGNEGFLPSPLIFELFMIFLVRLPVDHYILLHPVAFAGWVGMIVTMLNLLPAAMLDGGHVARSLVGDKARAILTALSILLLIIEGFWPMAIFVLFISMYRHPGPLDDVSKLSSGRKLLSVALVAIFLLCSLPFWLIF